MNAKDAIRRVREDHELPPDETVPPPPSPAASVPPAAAPVAGATDMALEPWMQSVLDGIKKRFVDERTNGFTHPSGQTFGPVPREQAEARWEKAKHRFIDVLRNDPEVRARFEPRGGAEAPAASPSGTEPAVPEPPVDEPAAEEPPAEVPGAAEEPLPPL